MKKVLLIENVKDLRESISEMLFYNGFKTIGAANGIQGIRLTRQIKPDIILCDIRMPEMDGFDLLKNFSQEEYFLHIPFIYLTALTDREKFRQGMELGADDFLTKPFTMEELLRAIHTQLKKYEKKENYIREKIDKTEKRLNKKLLEIQKEYESQKNNIVKMERQYKQLNHCLKEKELEVKKEALRTIEISNTIQNMKKIINNTIQNPDLTTHQKDLFIELRNKVNQKKFLVDKWTIFQLRFNQLYPHFMACLTQKYEKLTQYDLLFISATRMGLNTNQISDLLNISPGSARKSRYRLKKKMGLKKEDDFLKFIYSLNF